MAGELKYINLISDAVTIIEKGLETNINIESVTSEFEYSHWQFQRMFRRIAGNSMGQYLRARRLSESVNDLRANRLRVLDIALKYEFSSQEAYARAFKQYFGMSPTDVRDNKDLVLPEVKPMLSKESIEAAWADVQRTPEIIELKDIVLAGEQLEYLNHFIEGTDCRNKVRPHWEQFLPKIKSIPNRTDRALFGAMITSELEMREKNLKYFSGVPVSSVEGLPPEFDSMILPGGTYAKFDSLGISEKTYCVVDYIYGIWLSTAKYKRARGYDFEYMDHRYKPGHPSSTSSFYVPVEPI